MTFKTRLLAAALGATVVATSLASLAYATPAATIVTTPVSATQVRYGSVKIDGLNIAYREAGDPSLPKLVLLRLRLTCGPTRHWVA